MKQLLTFLFLAVCAILSFELTDSPVVGALAAASILAAVPAVGAPGWKKKALDLVMKALQNFDVKNAAVKLAGSETQVFYEGELAVGTTLFADEAMTTPSEADTLELEGGKVVKLSVGVITEISDAPPAEDAQLAQARAELAQAQAKITALETAKTTAEAAAKEAQNLATQAKKDLLDIKNAISGDNDGSTPPAPKPSDKPLSVAERAAARAK